MRDELRPGNGFPDLTLPEHTGDERSLTEIAAARPLVLCFLRGWWCPKEQIRARGLVEMQEEIQREYGRITVVTVDEPSVGPTIRDARPQDAEALARLVEQLGYPTSAEAVARRVERLVSSEADHLVVAEFQGEVVGLASVHVSLSVEYDEPAAKLSAIVVDEEHRRRGIGEALVAAMETEARARGCCLIFLTTVERREDAHAFYSRIGFEETGRRFAKYLH